MLIAGAPLWLFGTNTYVVAADRGGPAVVVDAPPDPEAIGRLLATYDLTPVALLVTHGHVDHAGGVDGVASEAVKAYLHPDDVDMARHPGVQLAALMGSTDPSIPTVTTPFVDLEDESTLSLAGIDFTVLHTPGHTPGHCCFSVESAGTLFSGDQLFAGSIGRTDLPGGNTADLMQSMRERVMVLDDVTRVLPGHGDETTIGRERTTNPFRTDWQL